VARLLTRHRDGSHIAAMKDKNSPRTGATVRPADERQEREKRLAAALRANLAKRKAQRRLRDAGDKDPKD